MPKNLISIQDFSKDEILEILKMAAGFEEDSCQPIFKNKVIASIFFEPSTRTRLSFETAANRLGARVIGFTDSVNTSVSKGETLKDTIKMISNYADLIVMRHPLEGSARYASEVSEVPVINAGDGANQHPTQTLLDLYSIFKTQGTLENLSISVVGDLKYGRTVHSLLQAMSHFNPEFLLTSPAELALPREYKEYLVKKGIRFGETTNLTDAIPNSDIIYMTRVQRERFTDAIEYERVKNIYSLNASMIRECKPNMKILHPLPRVNEIAIDVDESNHAYYFQQARNGIFVRMAIITKLLKS